MDKVTDAIEGAKWLSNTYVEDIDKLKYVICTRQYQISDRAPWIKANLWCIHVV